MYQNMLNHVKSVSTLTVEECTELLNAIMYYEPTIECIKIEGGQIMAFLWKMAVDAGLDVLPEALFELLEIIADKAVDDVFVCTSPTVGWLTNQCLCIMKRHMMTSITIKGVHTDSPKCYFQYNDRKRLDPDLEAKLQVFLESFLVYANGVDFSGLRSYVQSSDMIAFGVRH